MGLGVQVDQANTSSSGGQAGGSETLAVLHSRLSRVGVDPAKTPPPREGTPGEDTAECGEI